MKRHIELKDINFNCILTGIIENSVFIFIVSIALNLIYGNNYSPYIPLICFFQVFLIPLINLSFKKFEAVKGNLIGILIGFFLATILFSPYGNLEK